jgi:hypothetical protein
VGVEPVRELGHGAHPPDPYLNGPVLMAGDDVPLATGSLRPHRHGRGPGVERKRAPGRTGAAAGRACRGRHRGRGPRGPGRRPGPPPGRPPARAGRWRSPAGRSRRRAAGQCARNRPGCRRSSTHGRPRGAPDGPVARRNALGSGWARRTGGPGAGRAHRRMDHHRISSRQAGFAPRHRRVAHRSGPPDGRPDLQPGAGRRRWRTGHGAAGCRSTPPPARAQPSRAQQGGRRTRRRPPATVEVAERPWETAS